MATVSTGDTPDHERVVTRLIEVAHAELFRRWTEPAPITQWFTPPPLDCAAHETMGFHRGWGIATDQRARLAATV